jgi:hypothetical protein
MVFGQRKHRASISRIPMLVATFGLLPAAMSHAIGSDSQRLFAIVIFGGLISGLVMSIFLLPTLYVWVSRNGDKLKNLNRASRKTHSRSLDATHANRSKNSELSVELAKQKPSHCSSPRRFRVQSINVLEACVAQ